MSKYKKKLGWQPGVNKRSVAELTLAFMISSLENYVSVNLKFLVEILSSPRKQSIREDSRNYWLRCVGKDLVELLKPFRCKVLVNDIKDYPLFLEKTMLKM